MGDEYLHAGSNPALSASLTLYSSRMSLRCLGDAVCETPVVEKYEPLFPLARKSMAAFAKAKRKTATRFIISRTKRRWQKKFC